MKKHNKPKYSKEHQIYIRKLRFETAFVVGMRVAIIVLLFGLWELLTATRVLDPFIMSSPSRVWNTLVSLSQEGQLWIHIGTTLYETVVGFAIATIVGTLIAILLWWSERARRILEPYVVVLNSLPKIALGPLIIIWVGANEKAIILMCVLICIVMTTISMLNSFISCDKDKILLMKSMGASKLKIFFKLVFPHSIPDLITVLKINVGLSWVGSIMGEYLVSKAGLGYLIVYGGQVFKLDLVMASTLVLCVLASGMYFLVALAERHFSNRH